MPKVSGSLVWWLRKQRRLIRTWFARDRDGKAYTVCDEVVNAMLLNKFLKEHRKVEEQAATIAQLKVASRLCFVPGFIQTQACPK
jgi:hypothetical protein